MKPQFVRINDLSISITAPSEGDRRVILDAFSIEGDVKSMFLHRFAVATLLFKTSIKSLKKGTSTIPLEFHTNGDLTQSSLERVLSAIGDIPTFEKVLLTCLEFIDGQAHTQILDHTEKPVPGVAVLSPLPARYNN